MASERNLDRWETVQDDRLLVMDVED
jgi:hypothetical protein